MSDVPHGLMWGLKASFLGYLAQLPDAQQSVSGGAVADARQRLLFPTADASGFDPVAGTGTLRFAGDVRFAAHRGMLFVMVAEPWVTFADGRAVLSTIDPTSHPALDRRIDLVDLVPAGWAEHQGALLAAPMAATLRPEGVPFFNDVYAAGEPFDPVTLRIPVAA